MSARRYNLRRHRGREETLTKFALRFVALAVVLCAALVLTSQSASADDGFVIRSFGARYAIQPDGSYELQTANTAGLRPGKYRVSVTILDQPDVPRGERSYEVAKSRIPTKYNDINSSGQEFAVEPGSNSIDIKLSSK